jgi:hypothetical protein
MAHGCRPFRIRDAYHGREPGYEEMIGEELAGYFREIKGESLTPEELSERTALYLSVNDRRATEVFDAASLDGASVVVADDVAAYCESLPFGTEFSDVVGVLVPPFERLWVEAQGVPNYTNADSWGVMFDVAKGDSVDALIERGAPDDRLPQPEAAAWIVDAQVVCEWRKGSPVGPVVVYSLALGEDGHWLRRDNDDLYFWARGPLFEYPVSEPDIEDTKKHFTGLLGPMLLTVSFMHCKNVHVRSVDPPDKLSRRHERKHGRPLVRYHVLDIEPMRRILDTEGEAQTKGLRHALHICRGHFKTYTEDAPLLGKHVGTYWWPAQVRGKATEGVIEKDYRVRLDSTDLGQTYREADEAATVAPAKEPAAPDDPDARGRGLRAHNATQNRLAEIVERAGFAPRSPKRGEPDYDLAWQDGAITWVAEVKSITKASEERQLRIAIGQVLRYRQHLSGGGREVRALIAVERRPHDESWVALCGQETIALVWPDVMAEAVGGDHGEST